MNRDTKIVIGTALILLALFTIQATAEGEQITGDTVFIDTEHAYISATPHTLTESGFVEFSINSKQFTGDIDAYWGFSKTSGKPKFAEYWNGNEWVRIPNNYFNFKNFCYSGNHLWYYVENHAITANEEVRVRAWIDINFNTEGKYDLIIKPSSMTFAEAKNNSALMHLDPWWDNDYGCRNEIILTGDLSGAQTDYQLRLNITYDSCMQADFDDLRFTNDTHQMDAWLETKVDSSYAIIWVKFSTTPANGINQTYYLYHGNAGVSNIWNFSDTFLFIDEFDIDNWSDVGGNIHVDIGNSYLYAKGIRADTSYSYRAVTVPTDFSYSFLWEPVDAETGAAACGGGLYHGVSASVQTGTSSNGVYSYWFETGVSDTIKLHVIASNGSMYSSSGFAGYSYGTEYRVILSNAGNNYYLKIFSPNGEELFSTSLSGITVNSLAYLHCSTVPSSCSAQWVRAYYDTIFISKYESSPSTYNISSIESIQLKYNDSESVTNIVAIDSEVFSDGENDTAWVAAGLINNVTMVVSNYNNGTGDFQITDGWCDRISVSGFNENDLVVLKEGDTPIEVGIIDSDGKYIFNINIDFGSYSITVQSYDNVTGVHGFVYEGTTGIENPLESVVVYIFNSTWSDTTVTDQGGYYAFTGLENTTYTLNFKKDRYKDVLYQYVTPINLSMSYKVIYAQKSTGDYYSRHYTTFTLKNIFGACYSDVDTVVHDNGAVEATGTTGTDGAVTFHLFEDVEYRITFTNASQGIDESITLTPRDSAYTVYVTLLDFSLDDSATVWASIDYYWTSERINTSHGFINFTYTDTTNSTWAIEYYINRSVNNSHNEPAYYFISSQNGTWVANSSYTVSQIVLANNTTFVCHFSADNPNLPSLSGSGSAVINFVQGVMVDLGWEDTWKYNTVGIVLIIFIGLLFGAANAHIGAVVVVLTGWFLWYIKWLQPPEISFVALCLATCLAVLFVMRKGESLKA